MLDDDDADKLDAKKLDGWCWCRMHQAPWAIIARPFLDAI